MTEQDDTSAQPGATKRQRIAKAMARAGLCSRRDAEAWIVEGRVSVNGAILTSPALDVGAEDTILVDGTPMPTADKTRLFLFHKPRGLVTSDHDPEGRDTVADFLRENWPEGPRVVTVGRLDINTEGLLLLTNDGGLARILELPQTGWLRRYRVRAKGEANPASLDALASGVTIDGVDYAGIEVKLDRVQGANCWLTMGLREGKNREVKRVLEHVGLEVNRLIRLSFGPFQLLDLPEGAVEEVRTRVLRDQLGETLAKQAGVTFEVLEPAEPATRNTRPARAGRIDRATKDRKPPPADHRRPPAIDDRRRASMSRPPQRPTDHRTDRDDTPSPKRERPVAGSRKYVSTLRTAEAKTSRTGPRKRIEHAQTQDRRDRTIKVERLMPARPAPTRSARARPRGPDVADGRSAAESKSRPRDRDAATPRPGRDRRGKGGEAPARRDTRPGSPSERHHASPSALGKRERKSRSGAAADHVQNRRPNAAKADRVSNPTRRDRREIREEQKPQRNGPRRSPDKRPPRNAPAGSRPPRGPSKPRR